MLLRPSQMESIVSQISGPEWGALSAAFKDKLLNFVETKAMELRGLMTDCGLLEEGPGKQNDKKQGFAALEREDAELLVWNTIGLEEQTLRKFLHICKDRYHRAVIEPATAVGAIAAQSLGKYCSFQT